MDSTKRILLAFLVVLNGTLALLPSEDACALGNCGFHALCGNPSCSALTPRNIYQICTANKPQGCCYLQHDCVDQDPGCLQSSQNFKLTCLYADMCP